MNAFTRVFPTTAAPSPGGPSSSRKIGGFTEKQLAVGGIVVAVGAGLLAARKNKKAGSTGLGSSSTPDSLGAGAYDSTANDVYGALQPQIESYGVAAQGLESQYDQLNTTLTGLPAALGAAVGGAIQARPPAPARAPQKPVAHHPAPRPKKAPPKARPPHPAQGATGHAAGHPASPVRHSRPTRKTTTPPPASKTAQPPAKKASPPPAKKTTHRRKG